MKLDRDSDDIDGIKGSQVSLKKLFLAMCENNIILIPGYQRNYTWSEDMAVKLIDDILNLEDKTKSIALISLFKDEGNNIHIIDGQQRFITLYLFYLALKSIEDNTETEDEEYKENKKLLQETFSKLKFQRDDKIDDKNENELKRKSFLSALEKYNESEESEDNYLNPDKELMLNNFKAIRKAIMEHLKINLKETVKNIFSKILTQLKILVNIVYNNPEDEFLNLNFYKTPFSICDRVRGKLLSSGVRISGNLISTRDISLLFESISKSLYINNDAYKLMIGEHINNVHLDPEKFDENRSNIIFENYRDTKREDYILSNNLDFSTQCFKDELVNIEYLKLLFMQQRLQDVLTVFYENDVTLKAMISENGKKNKFFYTLLDRFNEITMCIHNNDLNKGLTDNDLNKGLTDNDLNKKIEEILKDKDVLFDVMSGSLRKDIVSYSVKYDNLHQINCLFQNIEKPCDKDGMYDKDKWEKTEYSLGKNEDLARYVQSSGKYMLSMYADKRQELDISRNFLKLNAYSKQENKEEKSYTGECSINIKSKQTEQTEQSKQTEQTEQSKQTEQTEQTEQTVGEYLFSEKENYKMVVPVIQREYCMGSKLPQEYHEKDDNIITYIYNNYAKDKNAQIKLSAIVLHELDKTNQYDIEIFDGQQRTVTIYEIIRYLIYKINTDDKLVKFSKTENDNKEVAVHLKNIEFIDRLDFTTFLNGEYSLECENSKSYSESSIKKIRNYLNSFFSKKEIDECKSFLEYICNNVTFDIVVIDGEIPSLVQIFMDINGGEPLTHYEIFKCKINYHFKGLVENDNENDNDNINLYKELYKNWIHFIDNDWLNWFYNFMKTNETYNKNDVELNVIRIIEFCCRMISYEKAQKTQEVLVTLIKQDGFYENDFKDSECFIKELTVDDFKRITTIMNNLIKINFNKQFINENFNKQSILKFVAKEVNYNENKMIDDADYCVPEYNTEFNNTNDIINKFVNLFINSLKDDDKNTYRKTDVIFWVIRNKFVYLFMNSLKDDDKNTYRKTDVIFWVILNNLETIDETNIKNIKNAMIKYNKYDVWKGDEDLNIAYLRPNIFYKYDKLLLPIPDYYYIEMKEKKTIIFNKLYNSKASDFSELISIILTESESDCDKYEWNAGNLNGLELKQYKIYYKYKDTIYSNNDFADLPQSFGIKKESPNKYNVNNNLTIFNIYNVYEGMPTYGSYFYSGLHENKNNPPEKLTVYSYFKDDNDNVTHYITNYDSKYTPMAVLLSIYNSKKCTPAVLLSISNNYNNYNIDDDYIKTIVNNNVDELEAKDIELDFKKIALDFERIENDFKYYYVYLMNENKNKNKNKNENKKMQECKENIINDIKNDIKNNIMNNITNNDDMEKICQNAIEMISRYNTLLNLIFRIHYISNSEWFYEESESERIKSTFKEICQNAIDILSRNNEKYHKLLNLIFRKHYTCNSEFPSAENKDELDFERIYKNAIDILSRNNEKYNTRLDLIFKIQDTCNSEYLSAKIYKNAIDILLRHNNKKYNTLLDLIFKIQDTCNSESLSKGNEDKLYFEIIDKNAIDILSRNNNEIYHKLLNLIFKIQDTCNSESLSKGNEDKLYFEIIDKNAINLENITDNLKNSTDNSEKYNTLLDLIFKTQYTYNSKFPSKEIDKNDLKILLENITENLKNSIENLEKYNILLNSIFFITHYTCNSESLSEESKGEKM